ncbi:hypothetical protein A3768_5633 (plasmid) [Ralstonia solanacearum]|nr:hypothetical protein A3768_5633 [Ralstonia solanacearum]
MPPGHRTINNKTIYFQQIGSHFSISFPNTLNQPSHQQLINILIYKIIK